MKTIVASRNPDLAQNFARDLLRRSDVQLVTAQGTRDLLARLRQGADLCFIDRVLPDGDGIAACKEIRGDRKLANIPLVLVSAAGARSVTAEEARALGFAEMIQLPVSPGALSVLVGRMLGVPLRDSDRFAVRVHVYGREAAVHQVTAIPEYLGVSVDLSEMGMLVKAKRAVQVGASLSLRFMLPGQTRGLDLQGKVVRVDDSSFAPAKGVAVAFEAVSPPDREVLGDFITDLLGGWPFHWHVSRVGARQVVSLSGALQAETDLTPLAELRGEVDFRMRDFRRISSESVERWMELVRRLKAVAKVRLVECPVAFVHQANTIPNLLGGVEVVSFFAPYSCDPCGLEDERLIEVAALKAQPARSAPLFQCSSCDGRLAFDDLPERYFEFLT